MISRMRRGFTLIEVAVVLGVVSVVLSGVWSVANDARERVKQERFAVQLQEIVNNIRSYYQSQGGITGSTATMQPIITNRDLKIIPSDMLVTEGASTIVKHPWNAALEISAGAGMGAENLLDPQLFTVRLQGLAPDVCKNLSLRLAGESALPDVDRIWFVCPKTVLPLPAKLSDTAGPCDNKMPLNIVYRLRPRQN